MVNDKEMMITMPYQKGGYAVRPMDWAGIWDEKGRLEAGCNFTALFPNKSEAEEYCRICNDTLRAAVVFLREQLLHDESLRKGFISSISSALKESIMPFAPDEENAERVLDFIVGERPAKKWGKFEGSFTMSCANVNLFQKMITEQLEVVDITGYSEETILEIFSSMPYIKKFVTTIPEHYKCLQLSRAYRVFGEDDTLFGIPLIFDRDGKIGAAKLKILKGGMQNHDD